MNILFDTILITLARPNVFYNRPMILRQIFASLFFCHFISSSAYIILYYIRETQNEADVRYRFWYTGMGDVRSWCFPDNSCNYDRNRRNIGLIFDSIKEKKTFWKTRRREQGNYNYYILNLNLTSHIIFSYLLSEIRPLFFAKQH